MAIDDDVKKVLQNYGVNFAATDTYHKKLRIDIMALDYISNLEDRKDIEYGDLYRFYTEVKNFYALQRRITNEP